MYDYATGGGGEDQGGCGEERRAKEKWFSAHSLISGDAIAGG